MIDAVTILMERDKLTRDEALARIQSCVEDIFDHEATDLCDYYMGEKVGGFDRDTFIRDELNIDPFLLEEYL